MLTRGCVWIRSKCGDETTAWHIYVVVIGCSFALQGLALSAATQIRFLPLFADGSSTLEFDTLLEQKIATVVFAAVLFVVGLSVKIAATWTAGLNTYYYKDMFYGRDLGEGFIASGICKCRLCRVSRVLLTACADKLKWLKSPMYGPGNLQSYAMALLGGFWIGPLVALVFHMSIFAFDFFIEQPFVEKIYGVGNDDEDAPQIEV